jgi:UDP-N-acetylmuramate--alanine ligase
LKQKTAFSLGGLFLPQIIDASQPRRVHLVGIAGNGMRALADVLLGWGWRLSGSDLNIAPVQALADAGLRLFQGHAAERLPPETELVVYSDAVPPANPELRRAAKLGIPTLSYFKMLGQLGVGRRTVAVAGTHGKSTVTAMLAHLLIQAGLDPTVVCGAAPLGAASGGRAGRTTSPFLPGECPWVKAGNSGQWPVASGQ